MLKRKILTYRRLTRIQRCSRLEMEREVDMEKHEIDLEEEAMLFVFSATLSILLLIGTVIYFSL